jgi:hypothetical protein
MKERVYKNVRQPAGMLRQNLLANARLFILIVEPFEGSLVACWPRTDLPQLSNASEELLRVCLKRERSILIHSSADPLVHSLGQRDFESALCVPLLDSDGNAVGVIYADHTGPGAFSNTERLLAERMARDLTAKLPRKGAPLPQQDAPEPPSGSRPALVACALLGVFLVFWLLAPGDQRSRPPQPQGVAQPQSWTSDPAAVVSSLLQLLSLRELDQARKLLDPDLQKAISGPDFQSRINDFLADQARRWDLSRRTVRKGSITPTEATCYLDPDPALDDAEPWQWTLSRVDRQWRISAMSAGPLGEQPLSSNER